MADTIEVPGAGAVPRNTVIILVAGGAAIVGYSYWKRRQQPVTGTVDVNSGIGAAAYTGTPNVGGATGNATVPAGMPDSITTNAAWTQAATVYLEAHGNFDGAALTAALGKYLTRDPAGLTDAEVAMVQAARGAFGEPPVGGPYSIIHAAPSTPTNDGNDFPSDGPGLPPPGNYNPHVWIARPGDTALNVVPRMYAFDPAVNPPTPANLPRRTGVAQALIATNQHIMPPGINDPIPAGTAITYY